MTNTSDPANDAASGKTGISASTEDLNVGGRIMSTPGFKLHFMA